MVVHTVADGMVSGVVCVTVPLTDRLWCGCTHSSGMEWSLVLYVLLYL